MNSFTVHIRCRDSIVSRDGRPFGAGQGNRMRPVTWPLPSVVAGSLRTMLAKAAERPFSLDTSQELLQIGVSGLFPVTDQQLYLPAPNDCVVRADDPTWTPLRAAPREESEGGCDLPTGLQPVMLSQEDAEDDFKPKDAPAWWPLDRYADWLIGKQIAFDHRFLKAPETDERTHVKLEAETGTAEEAKLFTTAALPLAHLPRFGAEKTESFADRWAETTLATRVAAEGWASEALAHLNAWHPLGGERRLAHWQTASGARWDVPPTVAAALKDAKRVRMVLATPAIFRHGWRPGWLGENLVGSPWKDQGPTLRLVGVSIQRWRAVSGWSLADLPDQPRGPKPVKRMVPAGGVYFFHVEDGTGAGLASRWLQPVGDDEGERQDCRDGFGLAAWGTW